MFTPSTPIICANTELPVRPWRVKLDAPWPWDALAGRSCDCPAHDVLAVDDSIDLFERTP